MKPLLIISAICFASFLLLAACTAVPQPTATPEEITNLVQERPSATTTPTAIPTTAVSAKPSKTPRATQTIRPTRTPIPTITPTGTYTPSPTPTPIAWHSGITELIRVDDLVWSPTKNEFISYTGCLDQTKIQFVRMDSLEKTDITPKELGCYVSVLWHPSGNYFLFSSESQENWGWIEGWQVDSATLSSTYLEGESYYWGWVNEELQVSERQIGTGVNSINIYNVITEEGVSGTDFDGNAMATSENFVILETGTWANSNVAVLAQEEVSPEFRGYLHGTDIKFLGWSRENIVNGQASLFFSRYMDVLPNSDQVLTLTWEDPNYELLEPKDILTGTVLANLQLWDIQSDEVLMVKEGGVYGRFSPSGNELVTISASPDLPQLELLNRLTNETIIIQPAYAETDDFYVDVEAYTSFSPNGRFLTYYSPEQDLVVYDIAFGTFLPSVTAVPFTPVWSPDNGRFVYKDPDNGLSIYEIDSQTTYSLAQAGCDELRNPQWSFDGSFLSVDVPCGGTAVLQLP